MEETTAKSWAFWGARIAKTTTPDELFNKPQSQKSPTAVAAKEFWKQHTGAQTTPGPATTSPEAKETRVKKFESEKRQKMAIEAEEKAKLAAAKAQALAESLRLAKLERERKAKGISDDPAREQAEAEAARQLKEARALEEARLAREAEEAQRRMQEELVIAARQRVMDPEIARAEDFDSMKFSLPARLGVLDLAAIGSTCECYRAFVMIVSSPRGMQLTDTLTTIFVCSAVVFMAYEIKPREFLLLHKPVLRHHVSVQPVVGLDVVADVGRCFRITLGATGTRAENYTLLAATADECSEWLAMLGSGSFGFGAAPGVYLSEPVAVEHVGMRVVVDMLGEGVLRFFGPHHRDGKLRCGVELDSAVGINNGTIGVRWLYIGAG